jgi:hypothetical protein
VYSLTLPGASFYQQVRTLQHALALTEPTLVLLAVDFLDFLIDPSVTTDPYKWPLPPRDFERRLVVDAQGELNPAYRWQRLTDYRDALFSLTAFKDSLKTLIAQDWPLATTITAAGFNPANEYLEIIYNEGQHVLFEQKNAEIASQLTRQQWGIFVRDSHWSALLEALDRAIAMIQARGARVVVFINPYHAQYLEGINEAGYGPLFARWKQALADLVRRKQDVALWDFALLNSYTNEAPPSKGDKRNMLSWFLEPAHYRKELGDLLLRTMLHGNGCRMDPAKPAVGVRLH